MSEIKPGKSYLTKAGTRVDVYKWPKFQVIARDILAEKNGKTYKEISQIIAQIGLGYHEYAHVFGVFPDTKYFTFQSYDKYGNPINMMGIPNADSPNAIDPKTEA